MDETSEETSLEDILSLLEEEDNKRAKKKAELEALGEKFDEPWEYYLKEDRDEPIPDLLAMIPDILSHLTGLEVIEHTNAEEPVQGLRRL